MCIGRRVAGSACEHESRLLTDYVAHRPTQFADPSFIARTLEPDLGLCRNKPENLFDISFATGLSQSGQQNWKNNRVKVTR